MKEGTCEKCGTECHCKTGESDSPREAPVSQTPPSPPEEGQPVSPSAGAAPTYTESVRVLLDRGFRKVKKTAATVGEAAGGMAGQGFGLAKNTLQEAKTLAASAASSVAETAGKLTKVPEDIKDAVVEAKKLSSIEDWRQHGIDLQKQIKTLRKESEEIASRLYRECSHKKLLRVPGVESLTSSTPPIKVCAICGVAEEGEVGQWSAGFFRLLGEGDTITRLEAEPKILRLYTRKEIKEMRR